MNKQDMLKKRNVVGYSEDLQKRLKGGKEVNEKAVRVYVSKKEPKQVLSVKDKVPEEIDGIKTDVVEIGEVTADCFFKQSSPKDHQSYHRPAFGGHSIGHEYVTAGTLGIVLKNRDNKLIGLSNNHVAANANNAKIGDTIYQPGPRDHNTCRKTRLGTLLDFVQIEPDELNRQDSAIFEVKEEDVKPNYIDGYGEVTGFDLEPEVNMQVRTSGRTKPEFSEGLIRDTNATIAVKYNNFYATFHHQILTTPISAGGDSGSVCLSVKNKIVGLLFAGSEQVTVLNKIEYPKQTYGLQVA